MLFRGYIAENFFCYKSPLGIFKYSFYFIFFVIVGTMSQSKRGNALALSKSKQSSRNHGHTSVRSNLMSSDSRKSTQGGTIPSDKSSLIRSTIHVSTTPCTFDWYGHMTYEVLICSFLFLFVLGSSVLHTGIC